MKKKANKDNKPKEILKSLYKEFGVPLRLVNHKE
jgi:hypothetical protein